MRQTLSISTVAALLALASSAAAQHPTILDSYRRAYELLDAAVAAHGGAEALATARQMRLTARGYEYHPHQSRRIAPLDSTVMDLVLMTDIGRGRVVFEDTRGYAGGLLLHGLAACIRATNVAQHLHRGWSDIDLAAGDIDRGHQAVRVGARTFARRKSGERKPEHVRAWQSQAVHRVCGEEKRLRGVETAGDADHDLLDSSAR
jgi:hypothetical protein